MGRQKVASSGTPRWPQQVTDPSSVPLPVSEVDPSKESSPHQFSMQQEARNTEFHGRLWSNSSLRHKAVRFVSAGEVQRSEFEDADQPNRDGDTQNQTGVTPKAPEPVTGRPPSTTENAHEALFYIDTTGQQIPDTGFPDPTPRPESIDSDDTSEDEVVFTGRKSNTKPVVIETTSDQLQEMLRIHTDTQQTSSKTTPDLEEPTAHSLDVDHDRITSPTKQGQTRPEGDDILADYIANIDHDYYEEVDEDSVATTYQNGHPGTVTAQELEVQSSIDGDWHSCESKPIQANAEALVLSRMNLDAASHVMTVPVDGSDESDEFDESEAVSEDGDDIDAELLEDLALEYANQRKKGGPRGKHQILSASAFADALESDPYYGFDIMDFDRPSLQKKGKNKKPPALDLMISDSDMEFHLEEVWQTDRKKKKAKKKEREELRSQGLLGRNPGDPDLKVKYANGMNVEEVMTEIRAFLLSSRTSLSLPPMTKQQRKTIHELANIVNLKSQSRGDGPARFTMLLKTSRTAGYTRKTISKVDSLLSGRKLNRRLFQSWGSGANKSRMTKSKRGAVGGTVSYMDGDVVGASAPEIGAGNRGRAMLEKMGWSSGTALGATDNKGILLPVAHVVKNTRAGLG